MSIEQAIAHHRAGRLLEADAAYRQVLAFQPDNADALHYLGVLSAQRGDMQASVELVGRALKITPNAAMAHFHMAEALRLLGRLAEAEESYARTISLKPEFAEAHCARAGVLIAMSRWKNALEAGGRAIALRPDLAEAHVHRGRALCELGRAVESLDAFGRALALRPLAEAHVNRGAALAKLGRSEEALADFEKVIELAPGNAEGYLNRGNVLLELGRVDEALDDFQSALAAQPDLAETYYNFGGALLAVKQYGAALAAFDSAVTLKPDYAEAFYNRSSALNKLGRKEESVADSDRALAINPELGLAAARSFFGRAALCDWTDRAERVEALKRVCRNGALTDPFVVLAAFDEPGLHLAAARTAAGPMRASVPQTAHTAHERLRVAYLSPDFREHPVAYQAVELLERHDRARFETYAICLHAGPDSPIRSRLKAAFDHFLEAEFLSDRATAELLAENEIDIAVDLGGHTDDARTKALAYRPAPVSALYLGYPGTSGAQYIDYIIADAHVIPAASEVFYSEKVVRLPHSFFPVDSRGDRAGRCPSRAEENLPPDGFVFCTFNSNHKFTPEIFDVWLRLVRSVEGSVLWLRVENPQAQANLRAEAERRGVGQNRLVFAARAERERHLARIALADLFLDTTPYGAHSTANDALWAGVPVVTCLGRGFASRVAASMLTVSRAEELIVPDLATYESLALELARSPARLAAIREHLTKTRRDNPLFDTAALCRELESAYDTMWDIHRKGQKPRGFSVNIAAPVDRGFH